MNIAVTGASGFIGSHLLEYLKTRGHRPTALSRAELAQPELSFSGADAVVHLAGIAHSAGLDAEAYWEVNCALPVRLARAAAQCGVRRFVFVSSSHAESHTGMPYGASKAEAERQLLALGAPEIVVIRPTLVYGPRAKGNFRTLLRLAQSPLPLPFAATQNRRSMVYIGNLVDALIFAAEQPGLAGRVFTVTDPGEALTLGEIVGALRGGAGRPKAMFAAPWLPGLMRRLGAGTLADKLFAPALFDGSALFQAGWTPPYQTLHALERTARQGVCDD